MSLKESLLSILKAILVNDQMIYLFTESNKVLRHQFLQVFLDSGIQAYGIIK